jgi:hypothetical protein
MAASSRRGALGESVFSGEFVRAHQLRALQTRETCFSHGHGVEV